MRGVDSSQKTDLMTLSSGKYVHLFLFLLLLMVGAGLRALTLDALSETVYFTSLLPDEQYYHDWAQVLLKSQTTTPLFEYAPLPAYLMALVYKIFGVDLYLIRVLNSVLNLLGCVVVYCIARKVFNCWWSLLALGFAVCSRELIFYSVVPLKTSLSFFLFSLVVYLVLCLCRRWSWAGLLFLGLVIGLAMNVRPNILILMPVIILLIFFYGGAGRLRIERGVGTIVLFLGFLLTSMPLSIHNSLQTGNFSFLPVQSGFLFYCANSLENPTPRYRPVSFASSHPQEQGTHFVIEASRRQGHTLDAKQASRYWQGQVVKEAVEDLALFWEKICLKGLMLCNFAENGDHYNTGFMAEFIPLLRCFHPAYWCIMLLGYSGLVMGIFRSREMRWLACLLGAYLFSLFLYSTGNRFVLPMMAILAPAGVWYCRHLFHLFRERRGRGIAISFIVAAIFLRLGTLDLPYASDLSNHYNSLAFFYNQRGELQRAVGYWQKSAALKQTYSDTALLFLSGHNYRLKGVAAAIETLDKIPDTSFMAAAKYATLGDIHKHHGRVEEALKSYEKSLAIHGGQRRVRKEIITMLLEGRPKRAEREKKQLEWVNSFYQPAP